MLTIDILAFAIVSIVLGLISVLYGYQIFKFFLMIAGFVLGVWFIQTYFPQSNVELTLVLSILGGIIGAVIANFLYTVGFAINAGILAAGFAGLALNYLAIDLEPTGRIVLVIIAGVLGALLVLMFNLKKLIIVSLTVLYGVYLLLAGGMHLVFAGNLPPFSQLPQATALGLLLIAGIIGVFGFFKQMNDPEI